MARPAQGCHHKCQQHEWLLMVNRLAVVTLLHVAGTAHWPNILGMAGERALGSHGDVASCLVQQCFKIYF